MGEVSSDKSEARLVYKMPSKEIFDGLSLKYSTIDGEFVNESNEIIVTNINPNGVLISKRHLDKFLNDKDYELIWTVQGEKMAVNENNNNWFTKLSGVYYFKNSELDGAIRIFNYDDN